MKNINKERKIHNFRISTYYKVKNTEIYNNHNMIIIRLIFSMNSERFKTINQILSK